MEPEFIQYTGYPLGGLINIPATSVKHDKDRNDWYVKHANRVYNCHPKEGAVWPVRFEVQGHDLGIYPSVVTLFPEVFGTEYVVVVGNIGTVYTGRIKQTATEVYDTYVGFSKECQGRGAGESVTLFADGEIALEYHGTNCQEEED